jgi:hypothetical protein
MRSGDEAALAQVEAVGFNRIAPPKTAVPDAGAGAPA